MERRSYIPFDIPTLKALYPSHVDYVFAVTQVTKENRRLGYILLPDVSATINDAKASIIGRLENLSAEQDRPLADFDRNP